MKSLRILDHFFEHLKDSHEILEEAKIQHMSDRCYLAKKWCGSFWCGFCIGIRSTSNLSGGEQVQERFSHIESHYRDGKMSFDWICDSGHVKGHGTTVLTGAPRTEVSRNTTLLYHEDQQIVSIKTTVEGENVDIDVYKDGVSVYNEEWIIVQPLYEWMDQIRAYQRSLPGGKLSGEGVCRPHEYLAIYPDGPDEYSASDPDGNMSRKVREFFEQDIVSRDLSRREVWDSLGPQAPLMMLVAYRGKQFNIGGFTYRLQSWIIVGGSLVLEFDAGLKREILFSDCWNLRDQGITLTQVTERFGKCPPLWTNHPVDQE